MSVAPPVRRLTRARRRMRVWLVALGAVLTAAIVTTALVGGFGDRPVRALASTESGVPVDTGEITVRLDRAEVRSTGPAIRDPTEGARWLVVSALLENHTDAPVDADVVSLRVRGATIDALARPEREVRLADGADAGRLQPGLPTRIAWTWRIEDGATVPTTPIAVLIAASPRKLGDPVYGDAGYGPLGAVARATLPVTVRG